MIKIVFSADNDINSDAAAVNEAMIKENADLYCFIGDGPYAKTGAGWVAQQDKTFGDKKDKLILSRGNHDEDESEAKQTQKDIEAWLPEAKSLGISDTWLLSKKVGNVYVISMDTQDMDIEFKRDQYNWVEKELEKAKGLRNLGQIDWIVVLAHKPFFTLKSSHSPYTAVRFLYKELFRDAQVDFVVHGHNHNTQLWYPMIPNDSQANGEGEQLFKYRDDGKTFDFVQDRGQLFIVTGRAGREWNKIDDGGAGVANVQHYRDEGKFGFTSIEFTDRKARVMSKDVDNGIVFECPVSREGVIGPPPPPECKPGEHLENGVCVPDVIVPPPPPPPPPTDKVVCPQDYHYEKSKKRCIPDLEPKLNPKCPKGYKWNKKKGVCEPDGIIPPPPPPIDAPVAIIKPIAPFTAVGQKITLDGSGSKNANGFKWEQTKGTTATIADNIVPITTATIPDTKEDLEFKLTVVNTKLEVNEAKVPAKNNITVNPPPPPTEIDDFGMKMLFKPTGNKKAMEEGTDRENGKRYNTNHAFHNYIMQGYYKLGSGQAAINHKGDGPNRGGCTDKKICLWYEFHVELSDGKFSLQFENPHPKNNNVSDDKLEHVKSIGKLEAGKWIGWATAYYWGADGFRHMKAFIDKDPFPNNDPTQKPNNNWIEGAFAIEKGQIVPGVALPRDLQEVIDHDNQFESEIRMRGATSGDTEMKNAWVIEIDPKGTVNPPPPPPPPPTECLPSECKDPVTKKCRKIASDEIVDQATGECRPKPIDPPPPPPPPDGEVLWDSNVHLKTGQKYTITDTHGSQDADGKGVFMAASGNPRLHVDEDGTFHLEADGGRGRVYIKARNYNARMEGELMFEDDAIRNTTLRLRSRRNMGGACENRFGGFGVTVERAEQLAETSTERCHNEHSNTVKKPLEKNIEVGKWLKFKYSCWNNADKKAINQKLEYDYNDGAGFKTVLDESFTELEPHMMDEAKFMEESYAWLRVNNESTGKVAYRNVRIVKI